VKAGLAYLRNARALSGYKVLGGAGGRASVAELLDRSWLLTSACLLAAALAFFAGPLAAAAAAAVAAVVAISLPRPAWALVFLVLASLLATSRSALTVVPGSDSLASAAGPARGLLLALLGFHALSYVSTGQLPLRRLIWPLLPLVAVIFSSVLVAPTLPGDAPNALPFALLLLSGAALAWPFTSSDRSMRAVISAIAAAYGLVAILNLLPITAQSAFIQTAEGQRFQGILENPNSVGTLGFAGVPALVAAGLLQPRGTALRLAWLALAGLLTVEVVASQSRGGIAGLLVAVSVTLLIATRQRLDIRKLVAALLVATVALVWYAGAFGGVSDYLRLSTLTEAGGRADVWPAVIDKIEQRPLLGYGYGSSPEVFEAIGPIETFVGSYSGNVFVDAGLELGIAGLGALLLAIAIPLWRAFAGRHFMSDTTRVLRTTCIAIVVGGLANAQAESFMLVPGGSGAIAFWVSLGICAALGIRCAAPRGPLGARDASR
jgi:O-antigen ligase